ncbi:DegV family protein [Blautia sp. An46]|uniref:DegV family protein n=1 Tax=Blautia sp. An46 TaxID=1965636 RepID=UPI000B3A0857|nr:DegV family protein [Blautia sp. An46]OUN92782.1 fatty acid-binding protein DegV [Blautia sp. An46]HJD36220.1 DegV family protein [Candidatus Blautia ornithocaccae]
MRKIILSADSTCDLGDELKEKYQVHYYPFHIILEGKDYQDNVDITPGDIFQRYYEKKVLPKTAAINVEEYVNYFRPFVEQGYEVVHLNLGSALSSAHQNCMLAARELKGVYPVDSGNLSTGIGHLVLDAGEMIKEGLGAEEIAGKLNQRKNLVHSSFILDTLKFMSAGGRCSNVMALGANLLNIKPCIEVNNKDGSMDVGKKYRGSLKKVLPLYVKDKLQEYQGICTDKIFITHSGIDQEYIELVKEAIQEEKEFQNIYVTRASCTISCHCGPNTLGILFETKE